MNENGSKIESKWLACLPAYLPTNIQLNVVYAPMS